MAEPDDELVLLAEWQVSLYVARDLPPATAAELQERAQAALDEGILVSTQALAASGPTPFTLKLT